MTNYHLPVISTTSLEAVGVPLLLGSNGDLDTSASGTVAWPVANLALYIPFSLVHPVLVTKLFVLNGSVVSGNVDIGVYSIDGTRLISAGSTAQSGVGEIQTFDVSDTFLGIGAFYLAAALDNATGRVVAYPSGGAALLLRALGMKEQTSAFPLPASATFAATTRTNIPYIGLVLAPRTVV